MPRKKVYYNYWELPSWDKSVVNVNKEFIHLGIVHLSLMDGNNIYKIKKPKRGTWGRVKEGKRIVVTKHMRKEKMAVLELIAVEVDELSKH